MPVSPATANPIQSFRTDPNMTPDQAKRQRAMGEALMQQGASVEPVQHWTQALARVAQAGIGGWEANQAGEAEKAGRGDFQQRMAKALEGGIDPQEAMTLGSDPWASEGAQGYLWKSLEPKGSFRPATAEEKAAYGVPPESALVIDTLTGKPSTLGDKGVTTNIITGDQAGVQKELNKDIAKEVYSPAIVAGGKAVARNQELEVMAPLLQIAPQGPITGKLLEYFPGFSTAGAAFNASVKRIIPTLREPGSGAQSDRDMEVFEQGWMRLGNTPEANQLIFQTIKAKNDIDIERRQAVLQFQRGKMSEDDFYKKWDELDTRSVLTPELRKALARVTGEGGGGDGGGGGGGGDGAPAGGY